MTHFHSDGHKMSKIGAVMHDIEQRLINVSLIYIGSILYKRLGYINQILFQYRKAILLHF